MVQCSCLFGSFLLLWCQKTQIFFNCFHKLKFFLLCSCHCWVGSLHTTHLTFVMMFTTESLLNQAFPRFGMSQIWLETYGPPFVPNFNVNLACLIFLTYFGLQKIVSVESLSRSIGSFNVIPWAKEHWIPAHPICPSFFSTLCVDRFVVVVPATDCSSFFACACDWALLIAHSSQGIFSLCLQYGDFCPALLQQ